MSIKEIKDALTPQLLTKGNVQGTGVGNKWVEGKPTNQEAIIVFVQNKASKKDIFSKHSAEDLIPTEIDGVPVDVIEVGRIVKHGGLRKKIRPILPGYSCGHKDVTAGTIGGFFIDKDGHPVILSNNHTIAAENKARKGDPIYQPGLADSRNLFPIAQLKSFIKLRKQGNIQDSAIARINPDLIAGNLVTPIYPTVNRALMGFGQASAGIQVYKCGRTTGYTTGRIIATNSTFTVEYDFGSASFDECIVLSAMSQGGDSGSIIADMDSQAVGLLFAGSPQVTLANPINYVRDHYGLQLWDDDNSKQKFSGGNWRTFTTDGALEMGDGVITITENANHHCFIEQTLESPVSTVACTVNTGSDRGATWGPGIVLQWPIGMIKVNLRHNGPFGGYFNSTEYLNLGKTQPGKDYRIRITKTSNAWVGQVKDGRSWFTVVSVPLSVFPMPPMAVRVGKTGELGSTTDHSPPKTKGAGAVGTCRISDIRIS